MRHLGRLLAKISVIAALALSAMPLNAQFKPRWVRKDIECLNKKRSNTSYEFVKTEEWNADAATLRAHRFDPLVKYLRESYMIDENMPVRIDSLYALPDKWVLCDDGIAQSIAEAEGKPKAYVFDKHSGRFIGPAEDFTEERKYYLVRFHEGAVGGSQGNGMPATSGQADANRQRPLHGKISFQVKAVDDYFVWTDDVDGNYDYELHNLYAVSGKDTEPLYDNFHLTTKYKASATLLSIIPGLGQIYKGQIGKGVTFMSCEVALLGGTIGFASYRNYCNRMVTKESEAASSWKSKAHSAKAAEFTCLGFFGGLWIYNILDAALSKGARQVVVRRRNGDNLSVSPAGLTYTF